MIGKNKLKQLAAYRLQKRCDEEAVFVVEGPKMAGEALVSGFEVVAVCATVEWEEESRGEWEFYEVTQGELERLSNMRAPNQVWMLLRRPSSQQIQSLVAHIHHTDLILALDHIQDPGNLGTLLRIADWYGVRHVVCSEETVGCYTPKVVQASMGAVFRTQVDYVELPEWLAGCGRSVYGASLQGDAIDAAPRQIEEGAVLLIGNESRGIGAEAMRHVTHPVLIPNIGGTAESLNAAVAAGILMNWMVGAKN